MARKKRYSHYVRIGQIGQVWAAYVGWTCDQRIYSRHWDNLDELVAECRRSYAGEEVQLPPQEVVDAGLPPWPFEVLDEVVAFLSARPGLNPDLLQKAIRAREADRHDVPLPWSAEAESQAAARQLAAPAMARAA